ARGMGSMNGAASAPPPSSNNKNVKNPYYKPPSASSPASNTKTTNNPHYKPPPNAANQRPQQSTYTFANKRQTQKVRGVPVETFNRNGSLDDMELDVKIHRYRHSKAAWIDEDDWIDGDD